MARMSIDDMVVRDPRITKLSGLVGWSRRETIGCLIADVWPICYDQKEAIVSADLVDLAAGLAGFADAMVQSELATWVRGNRRIRVRGAQERIEYLDKKKRAGHVGGVKSAESRSKKPSTTTDDAQARGNPTVPDPVLVPASVPDPDPDPPPALLLKKPASPPARAIPGTQDCTDLFFSLYSSAYGSKPTWGGRQGSEIKRLLKAHPPDEVQRRMRILFESPPSWLKPPFDFGTFVQHFDKLVVAVASGNQTGRVEPKRPEDYPQGEIAL